MRAACTGVLDRALDVAAALEVRGYGAARRPPAYAAGRAPYSRHDVAFLAAALVVVAVSIVARVSSVAAFSAYPVLSVAAGPGALLPRRPGSWWLRWPPFANRRGMGR